MVKAVAVLSGSGGTNGTVSFTQEEGDPTTIQGILSGFPAGNHALVVHTSGDITNVWISTGIPFGNVGTGGHLANITVGAAGTATFTLTQANVPLRGQSSIIGRGLVVHAGPDSNPGAGLAWGVIGLAN